MKNLVFVLLFCIQGSTLWAEGDGCFSALGETTKVRFRYCLSNFGGPTNKLIYYFHPAMSNEQQFRYTWALRNAFSASSNPVNIVAITFEDKNFPLPGSFRFWDFFASHFYKLVLGHPSQAYLVTPQIGLPNTGLLETFVADALPQIEKQIGVNNPERGIVGVSMGGFNVAQISTHPLTRALFSKAVLIDAFLINSNPFEEDFKEVNQRNWFGDDTKRIDPRVFFTKDQESISRKEQVELRLQKSREYSADSMAEKAKAFFERVLVGSSSLKSDFKKIFPLEQTSDGDSAIEFPKFLVVTSTNDPMFYEPNLAFSQRLKSKGARVEVWVTSYSHGMVPYFKNIKSSEIVTWLNSK